MGGKALKNSPVTRVDAAEHQRISQMVTAALTRNFPRQRNAALPHYAKKETFGNLSVFLQSESPMDKVLVRDLVALLGATESVLNGNMVSLAVENLQVDITVYPAKSFQTALDYHSYNTLGGLIGRLADSIGLTLRDDSLVYKRIQGTQLLAEITLATTWQGALTELGLDYQRWTQGFETLADMFAYVTTSPLFAKALYSDAGYKDVPSGIRLTVSQEFSKWLDTVDPRQLPPDSAVSQDAWLEAMFKHHPTAQTQLTAALQRHADVVAASKKLNGNLVIDWTGRQGYALGQLLRALKSSFDSEEALTQWTLAASEEDIKSKVFALHASV